MFKKIFNKFMNIITINGTKHTVTGKNIQVRNNSVYVDGKLVVESLTNDIHVTFEGDLAELDCTSATINGNVMGSVDCTSAKISGDVKGNVDGTSINIQGNVGGDVDGVTVSYKK